jgi:hypothetical protein
MDPNETLRQIRELVAAVTGPGLRTNAERAQLGAELAGLLEEFDAWLCRGGVLPQPWRRPGPPRTVTIIGERREPASDAATDAAGKRPQ